MSLQNCQSQEKKEIFNFSRMSSGDGPVIQRSRRGSVKVNCSRIVDYRSLNEQQVEDITLDFFYKPHTLSLLVCVLCALLYTACTRDNNDNVLNIYQGLATIR